MEASADILSAISAFRNANQAPKPVNGDLNAMADAALTSQDAFTSALQNAIQAGDADRISQVCVMRSVMYVLHGMWYVLCAMCYVLCVRKCVCVCRWSDWLALVRNALRAVPR